MIVKTNHTGTTLAAVAMGKYFTIHQGDSHHLYCTLPQSITHSDDVFSDSEHPHADHIPVVLFREKNAQLTRLPPNTQVLVATGIKMIELEG